MKNVIMIVGPTGVGKTKLSLILAEKLNTEIISCDSMQVYRGMDIGTAKVEPTEQELIKHHLIDVVNPDEEYNVSNFQEDAFKIIDSILTENKIPIIVGGTGLYINSLTYNLDFSKDEPDEDYRQKLWSMYDEKGQDSILELVKEVDPQVLKTIDENNIKRLIRALEYHHTTGKKYSEKNTDFRNENNRYDFHIYCLEEERSKLYERINKRVDKMLEDGLVNEVKALIDSYDQDAISFKGIGYKEVISYLNGEVDYDEMVRLLKRNSRRLAKRQYTWFRRDDRINWVDIGKYNYDFDKIAEEILRDINE